MLSVSPTTGTAAGGTPITITLDPYVGSDRVTGVTVDGTAATSVSAASATTVTATTPAGSAGLVGIAVTNPWGTARLRAAFTYVATSDELVTEGSSVLHTEASVALATE